MQEIATKPPPHNHEAERSVIGAMMLDTKAIETATELLSKDSFYNLNHATLFEVIAELHYGEGIKPDLVTIAEKLNKIGKFEEVGGVYAISDISVNTPTAANITAHARIVQEQYIKRQLIKVTGKILESAYDPTASPIGETEKAQSELNELLGGLQEKKNIIVPKKAAGEIFDTIALIQENGGIQGLYTGFHQVDYQTNGFMPGDLVIIAARPSVGKTAIALNMAMKQAIYSDIPIGFISLEMSWQKLLFRLIASDTKINSKAIQRGEINQRQIEKITEFIARYAKSNFIICDASGISISELRRVAREFKQKYDIQALYVDYLQIVHAPGKDIRERISNVSTQLKATAKELGIPVVALAQINRESDNNPGKRPTMKNLKESGQIEQDADIILALHNDDDMGYIFICLKQRDGAVFIEKLNFNKESCLFTSIDTQHDEQQLHFQETDDEPF